MHGAPEALPHQLPDGEAPAASPARQAEILLALNGRQREAVTHRGAPLLVLAGAGSGKTRVLISRVAHLVATGTPARQILAITFTNKAAEEMRGRLRAMLGTDAAAQVLMGTFHAVAARWLRHHAHLLGRTERYSIWDDEDARRAVGRLMSEAEEARIKPREVVEAIARAKNGLIDLDEYAAWAREREEKITARVWAAYEQELVASDAFDLEDLLGQMVRVLDEHPDIRSGFADRWRHVLVDEAQDCNAAQFRLLRLLAADHRSLTLVGDDDQSIYRWRGAAYEEFLAFERRHFPDAQVIKLEENYRSTGHILEAANRVIAHNRHRRPKVLFTRGEAGQAPEVRWLASAWDEARYIAASVRAHLEAGVAPEQVAVLYRSRRVQRQIESALVEHGIAFEVLGGSAFYELAVIRDAMAHVRLLVNPHDREAFARAINAPRRGVGQAAERLIAFGELAGLDLIDACRQAQAVPEANARQRAALELFGSQMAAVRDAPGLAPHEALTRCLMIEGGMVAHAKARAARDKEAERALGRLRELVRSVIEWERQGGGALVEWLQQATLATGSDEAAHRGRVALATIHAAKGLEWQAVFVAGCEDGILPSGHAQGVAELEEERRLAYVAITRARRHLALTGAAEREGRARGRSPYLAEAAESSARPAGRTSRTTKDEES